MALRVGIVVGECSGDLLAAALIQALRVLHPDLIFEGVLGPKLLALGGKALGSMESLAVMGLIEPLGRLPQLLQLRHRLIKYFEKNPPDVFIGVDAPDFNLSVEKVLKKQGIKTVHYVSPSVWAWRRYRIQKIKKAVDLMLVLFPFESLFYAQHGVKVCFVGHPLADQIPLVVDKLAARKALNIPVEAFVIALLPGSRQKEIDALGATFIDAARYFQAHLPAHLLGDHQPDLRFLVPLVNAQHQKIIDALCLKLAANISIKTFVGDTHEALAAADQVLVASGTATLETMLYKKPMVVAYRMHPLTYQIARFLVKVSYIALPNLLANQAVVPEYIQDAATGPKLGDALLKLCAQNFDSTTLMAHFDDLHQILKQNASQKAAEAILKLIAYSLVSQ